MTQQQEKQDSFRLLSHTKNNRGQSTIEFLSSFAFAFALLFLFVKIAMNYTNGYMVHYANYMASRKYLIADNNTAPNSVYSLAANQSKQLFGKYYLNLFMPNKQIDFGVNAPNNTGITKKYYVGTYATYEEVLSFTKLVGGRKELLLTSESFLGKEPPRSHCVKRVCDALRATAGDCSAYTTVIDNGC